MNAASTDSTASQPVLISAPRMIGDFPGYYGTSRVTVTSSLSQLVPVSIIATERLPN